MQAASRYSACPLPAPRSAAGSRRSAAFSGLARRRSAPISSTCLAISSGSTGGAQGFGGVELLRPLSTFSEETETVESEHKKGSIEERVLKIKGMLGKMEYGEISVSPYDTAWVAIVRDSNNKEKPQFPKSLQWIAEHQLPDGSWGDDKLFEPHDRIINTLACIIALRSYDACPYHCHRGMAFLCENMHRIGQGDVEHMPIGFEMAFPSLLDIARGLGFELPYDASGLQRIYHMRRLKIERIPLAVMHEVPTTLLHSLEGMAAVGDQLDWHRLLPLQCQDGSFLFSPSSTAFALIRTGDTKCLRYLEQVITRFDGGVPNVYPVDLFEHLWVVDRLQRLGIARYFEPEVECCLDYVYGHWKEDGICWASNTKVQDVDDTAMGFRLLRLHGYHVSPDVFQRFRENGEFFCFVGQSSQAVTGMYNLLRAAQVGFAREEILEEARCFSAMFLREKQSRNQLVDKWIMSKDLHGEVEYTLDFPWFACLPRVETRVYLEQYGGDNDVWIGKTLYRMPLVSNNAYLELAKMDFNRCQAVHQHELSSLGRWLDQCGLGEHVRRLVELYFVAASSIFEPERSGERLAWVRTAVIADGARQLLRQRRPDETKLDLINKLTDHDSDVKNGSGHCSKNIEALADTILATIHRISSEASHHQTDAHHHQITAYLRHAWAEWLMTVGEGDGDDEALLICRTLELCAGRCDLEQAMSESSLIFASKEEENMNNGAIHGDQLQIYAQAALLVSSACRGRGGGEGAMRELLRCVLENWNGRCRETMRTFLAVAKSFFYVSHCPAETMEVHIAKVLFERVL